MEKEQLEEKVESYEKMIRLQFGFIREMEKAFFKRIDEEKNEIKTGNKEQVRGENTPEPNKRSGLILV